MARALAWGARGRWFKSSQPDMSIKQKLNSLYSQQRKLTAAKNSVSDPRLKRTLELKQQMMGRRIGRMQAEKKLGGDK
jgi:hypothetical protein